MPANELAHPTCCLSWAVPRKNAPEHLLAPGHAPRTALPAHSPSWLAAKDPGLPSTLAPTILQGTQPAPCSRVPSHAACKSSAMKAYASPHCILHHHCSLPTSNPPFSPSLCTTAHARCCQCRPRRARPLLWRHWPTRPMFPATTFSSSLSCLPDSEVSHPRPGGTRGAATQPRAHCLCSDHVH